MMKVDRRSVLLGAAAAIVAPPELPALDGRPVALAGLAFDPAAPGTEATVEWTAEWCAKECRYVVTAINQLNDAIPHEAAYAA